MRRHINNIISVICTFLRSLVWRVVHGANLKMGLIERFSPNVVCEFKRGSKINIGNKVRIHSGTKLKVRKAQSR